MTLAYRPIAPHRLPSGRLLPVETVLFDSCRIGEVCEVRPFVWWWRTVGMPHFAPAPAGPHRRDCGDLLLRIWEQPRPSRTGIPSSGHLLRACRASRGEDPDAEGA